MVLSEGQKLLLSLLKSLTEETELILTIMIAVKEEEKTRKLLKKVEELHDKRQLTIEKILEETMRISMM